jgi:histidyl-tRNA synthetase
VSAKLAREAARAEQDGHAERAYELHGARYSVEIPEVSMYRQYRPIWNRHMIDHLADLVRSSDIGWQGSNELGEIHDYLVAQGYKDARFQIDPSVVRGLGYYTGPVFEAELTFEILDEKGRKRQFGSVAGGGRYDGLVKRFTDQSVPATGVSIGVDRLLAALRAKGRAGDTAPGPVVVTVMDRDRMTDYMAMAAELRREGIRAEVFLGNSKDFGKQLSYADKRNAPIAIIQGSKENDNNQVQVKDLYLGKEIGSRATRSEWVKNKAQTLCNRVDIVETVRKILLNQKRREGYRASKVRRGASSQRFTKR